MVLSRLRRHGQRRGREVVTFVEDEDGVPRGGEVGGADGAAGAGADDDDVGCEGVRGRGGCGLEEGEGIGRWGGAPVCGDGGAADGEGVEGACLQVDGFGEGGECFEEDAGGAEPGGGPGLEEGFAVEEGALGEGGGGAGEEEAAGAGSMRGVRRW